MDLIYLEYFSKAADLQHITKAAQALNITQPTLSTAIRKLELELGTRLFEPDGRNVRLTRAGVVFQKHVRIILREVQAAYDELGGLMELQNSRIAIICPAQIFEREFVQKIHLQNPNIVIDIRGRFNLQTKEELASGDIELYISTPPYKGRGYQNMILAPDPVMMICSVSHRFARSRQVDIHDLAEETFISYPKSELRDLIDAVCRDAGFEPHTACEIAHMREMLPLIASGRMITLAPAGACQECIHAPDIAVVPISGVSRSVDMGISWPSERPMRAAVRTVRDTFVEAYRNAPDRLVRRLMEGRQPQIDS